MKYGNVVKGHFIERPNRFIARVEIDGQVEEVHVKNTGRMKELMIPGTRVSLEVSDNPNRKTRCDLITVEKTLPDGSVQIVNVDSQVPNQAAEEWLRAGRGPFSADAKVRREVKYGSSRFDIYVEDGERRAFMEVKGVTLEADGIAFFPDAPTERGVKHIRELTACMEEGYEAYILFVIKMKGVHGFRPNIKTHPAFGQVLKEAHGKGVHVLAVDCVVTESTLDIHEPVLVMLQ